MRLLDFLEDLRDTSVRISQREAYTYNDPNLVAHLTIKTLMRPDVTHYFDSLLAGPSPLMPCQAILGYLYLYAYMVNGRPRPVQAQMVPAGQQLAKMLSKFDPLQDELQYPPIDLLPLPVSIKRRVGQIFKLDHSFGLRFRYTQAAPECNLIHKLTNMPEASLWLYTTPPPSMPPESDRLIYADLVFASPRYRVHAVYISAT